MLIRLQFNVQKKKDQSGASSEDEYIQEAEQEVGSEVKTFRRLTVMVRPFRRLKAKAGPLNRSTGTVPLAGPEWLSFLWGAGSSADALGR